jgi:catechol 2,3-dioxygenase-like lactoylglutathione lyase family enzyme
MAGPRFGFVVEYVPDIEAARRFYVDVLGLKEERYHPTFVQFEHFAIASDAPVGASGDPEVYWIVDDAEAERERLAGRASGVGELRQMPFGKVFSVDDPAGRPQFVLEFARERPSQAV